MIELPKNDDLERAIIGHMFLDKATAKELAEKCDPVWFWHEKNALVFKIFSVKITQGIYPDITLACLWLSEANKLADVGGEAYFKGCIEKVEHPGADHYMAELRKLYYNRRIVEALAECGKDPSINNIEKLRIVREERDGCDANGILSFKDCMPQIIELIEPLPKGIYDVMGFPKNEEYHNGMQPGDILTFGARPGVGKTVFLTHVADNFARKYPEERVLIFSTEMTSTEVLQRMLAPLSGVEGWKFRKRKFFEEKYGDITKIGKAANELVKLNIHLVDRPSPTLADIRAAMSIVKPKLVILDYLQVVNLEIERDEGRPAAFGRFLYGLKNSLRSFEAMGIIASQLDRKTDKLTGRETPQLSDLKGSGDIEQISNSVVLAWQHNKKDKDTKLEEVPEIRNIKPIEFIHAKHRTGKSDVSVQMVFDENFICFREWNMETAERYNKDIIPKTKTDKAEKKAGRKNATHTWGKPEGDTSGDDDAGASHD